MAKLQEYEINVKPTVPQAEFLAMDNRYRGLVSGIGAGKTFIGAVEIPRMPAGSIGAVISPTYPMLRDTTLTTFFEVCGKLVLDYSKSDKECTLVNGTKIIFRSAEHPERLRGPNLGWFWLDEAAMMDSLVWKIMVGRLRLMPGRGWITTTPKGKANWVHRKFKKEKSKFYGLVQCPTSSNIYLSPEFIESLEDDYHGLWKKQEAGGEFVDFGSTSAYPEFKPARNVRHGLFEKYYNPRTPLSICCDFNVSIMSWTCIQVHPMIAVAPLTVSDPDMLMSQPYALAEISMQMDSGGKRANVPAMCVEIHKRFPHHTGGINIYGDASGSGGSSQTGYSHYDLIDKGLGDKYDVSFMLPRKNPPPGNRIITMNDLLSGTGYWNPLLIDADECPILIKDLEEVTLIETGDDVEKITDAQDERSLLTHSSDGVGYFATMEVPISSMEIAQQLHDIREVARYGRYDEAQSGRAHGAGLRGV